MDTFELIKQLSAEGKNVPDNSEKIIKKAKAQGLLAKNRGITYAVNSGGGTVAAVNGKRAVAAVASVVAVGIIAAAVIVPLTVGRNNIPPAGPLLCAEELGDDYAVGAVSAAQLVNCLGLGGESAETAVKTASTKREALITPVPTLSEQIENFGTYFGAFGTFFGADDELVQVKNISSSQAKYPNSIQITGWYSNGEKADFAMYYLEALDAEYSGDGEKYYLEGEIFIDGTAYYLEGSRTFITVDESAQAYDLVLRAYSDMRDRQNYVEMTLGVREVDGAEVKSYNYRVYKEGVAQNETLSYLPVLESDKAFDLIFDYGEGDSRFTVYRPEADSPIVTIGFESGTKRSSFKISQTRGEAPCVLMNNFMYTLNEADKTCSVTGYKAALTIDTDTLEIPQEIVAGNEVYTVTDIGANAFSARTEIKKVILPDTMENLGRYAFFACKNIEEVQFNGGLKTIGANAFESCTSLKSIEIPQSVTSLSGTAFLYCTGLEKISVEEGNANYSGAGNCLVDKFGTLFLGCVNSVIPQDGSVKGIGSRAFYGTEISSVTLPESLTVINERAFYNCNELAEITVPQNVILIDYYAFGNCSNLNKITLPDRALSIAQNAFGGTGYESDISNWDVNYGYEALYIGKHLISGRNTGGGYELQIKSGTLSIADYAFADESWDFGKYSSLVLNPEIELIGSMTYMGGGGCAQIVFANSALVSNNGRYAVSGNCLLDLEASSVIAGCETSVIPTRAGNYNEWLITDIGPCAFRGCNFATIEIPYGINTIQVLAFEECRYLESIYIPKTVTFIGDSAFEDCSNLVSVIFEENDDPGARLDLTRCFVGCDSLETLTLPTHVYYVGVICSYCSSLREINITMTDHLSVVELIDYCLNFETVNFSGTMEEWKTIFVNSRGLNFNVQCSDGVLHPDFHE